MLDLSIVIVSWNVKDELRNCIESIRKNILSIAYEIIVVDNNSSDGSLEMIEKEFPFVVLIRNNENVGFARATNQGIKISCKKYILLLNPDTVINKNSLKPMINFMERKSEVAACGPMILDEAGKEFPVASYPKLFRMISKDTFLAKIYPIGVNIKPHFPQKHEMTRNLSGSCIMLRREALNIVGVLNENIFLYYEETELLDRLYKKGWQIYYLPEAKIIHFGEKSTAKLSNINKLLIYKKSSFELWRSRYGKLRTVLLKAIVFALYSISLSSWLLRWPLQKERALGKINFYYPLLLLTLNEKKFNLKP